MSGRPSVPAKEVTVELAPGAIATVEMALVVFPSTDAHSRWPGLQVDDSLRVVDVSGEARTAAAMRRT